MTEFSDYETQRQVVGKAAFGFWDYLNTRGDFELAAAFGKLFWPEFIEVEGLILLAENYDEKTYRQWKQTVSDRDKIEAVINEVHVYDLFLNSSKQPVTSQTFEFIGWVLMKCWTCALKDKFPDRNFRVDYGTEPKEYGPTIRFYQIE
jgi:hypothetical protein